MEQKKPEREQSEETKQSRWGFRGMTVRAWLELLIVPLVLVGIGLLFEMQQADRQQAMEEQQQALEERRAEAERELAEQRAQDEALQAYLDQMSTLLLEQGLRNSEVGSEVRTLARARTLTLLDSVDPDRKRRVVQFLMEAELIQRMDEEGRVIGLGGADLSDARLGGFDLPGAGLRHANLRKAGLGGTNLSNADLFSAALSEAHLSNANLSNANLSNANLSGAYKYNSDGSRQLVTNEELEAQAASLEGAIMPDGQQYEEWLKSKGRGEDGENAALRNGL